MSWLKPYVVHSTFGEPVHVFPKSKFIYVAFDQEHMAQKLREVTGAQLPTCWKVYSQ